MISIVIVALIHIGIGYALVTGLAISAAKQVIQRVTTVDIEEPEPEEEEPPPPPPEENVAPPPPVAPPAPINIAPAPPPIRTVDTPPPPAPIAVRVPPPAPVAAPPPPPAPSRARAAQRDGQNRWAARIQANYPRRAVQREIEGNVGVSVTIGPDGRVTGCSVSNSSGNDDLDQAACEGMQRYARYEPALDDAGNPTSGRDSMTIVYRLGE
jgi:protein TonB